MTITQLIATLISAILVPFLVQAIKTHALNGNVARFVSIGASLIAGIATGFIAGIPADPATWLTCLFAVVGGVQVAYSAFKAVGITSKWLDALLEIGTPKEVD